MGCYYLTMSVPERQGRRHDLLRRSTKWSWPTRWARSTRTRRSRCGCRRTAACKSEVRREDKPGEIDRHHRRPRDVQHDAARRACRSTTSPLRSSELASVISRLLPDPRPPQDDRPAGRHEPARLPREHAQRPVVRHRRPDHARRTRRRSSATPKRKCCKINKLYQRGIITEGERYNQVLDAWTHAREQITTEMMARAGERLPRPAAT